MPEEPKFYESKQQLDEALKASETSTSALTPLQRDALIAQMRTIFYRATRARTLLLEIGLTTPSHSQAVYAVQDVLEASRKLALYLDSPLLDPDPTPIEPSLPFPSIER